jgi:uncharacterized protein YecT (DUF1311 family)
MPRHLLGLCSAVLLIAAPRAAADAAECQSTFVLPPGVTCTDPDADQIDQNCPIVWEQVEDCRLTLALQKLEAALSADPEQLDKLRASQRAWLKFRDADVASVVAHYGEGGSLGRSITSMHRFKLTRSRLRELENRLADSGKW